MDKKTFKSNVLNLLKEDVIGLSDDSKIKYMKKWIRDHEIELNGPVKSLITEAQMKIGLLIRTALRKIVSTDSLSEEQIRLLQDSKYCKNTFDINYPLLKKVISGATPSAQRKINGYDRYWEEPICINGEKFFVCNDWYERNRSRFINWVNHLN